MTASADQAGGTGRFQLRSGDALLTIDPDAGGRFASLVVGGHELLVTEGYGPIMWGCYTMAPFAGRIGQGRFTFRGRVYQLETAMPPDAIHGTVLDRPWSVALRDGKRATLDIDLGPGWPFAGRVRQEVALRDDGLTVALELTADEPMPAWVGWHPWFRREIGDATVGVANPAARMFERGADGLPTGRLVEPTSGPWDDAFTGLAGPARLTWPGILSLEIDADAPVRVVFDERPDAVCVEPQTAPPDAIRLAELAGTAPPLAEPGAPVSASMTWTWSTVVPG